MDKEADWLWISMTDRKRFPLEGDKMDEQNFRIIVSKQSGCRAGFLLSRTGIDYYRAGTQIQVYCTFV